MKNKKLLLWPLLCLLLVFSLAVPASATVYPVQSFYGDLTIESVDAPVGTQVIAKVAGLEFEVTTVTEGEYGRGLDLKLVVQGEIDDGATVDFYVSNAELGLTEVKANETAPFDDGKITELNLTVGEVVDVTPPKVVSTIPEAGATGTIDVIVRATFDEAIDEATLDFTLVSVAGTMSYVGATKTASFTPDANLDYEITYTASIQASDLVGTI